MAFISSATTLTLNAYLTPFGRAQLISSNIGLIQYFSLGDSDANYQTDDVLTTGQVPGISGSIGVDNATNNSTAPNFKIKTNIVATPNGSLTKLVELGSATVNSLTSANGSKTVVNSALTQNIINRTTTGTGSSLTNLFATFGLPITEADKTIFTGTTLANGGFSDTALSGLSQDKVLYISIPSNQYGESLDGKAIKVVLTTTASTATTYAIYGTYQQTSATNAVQDKNTSETSTSLTPIGNNVTLLFSDNIKKPSGNINKSWATGFNTTKPYSVNGKSLFSLTSGVGTTADTAIGVALLDKGFIVITEPTIVNAMDLSNTSTTASATTITFNHVNTDVFQSVTVIANRGEFTRSNNPTYSTGDVIRISEVGLHDAGGNLIAVAKPDRQILKATNDLVSMAIKINL